MLAQAKPFQFSTCTTCALYSALLSTCHLRVDAHTGHDALVPVTPVDAVDGVGGIHNNLTSQNEVLQVMRWMEQAAYIAASRVGRGGRHLLMASMDSIAFRHPTRVGDILYVSAQVLPCSA